MTTRSEEELHQLSVRRFVLAAQAARDAIAKRPEDGEAHNALGTALAQGGDLQGAALAYEAGSRMSPGLYKLHANLSKVLPRLGRTPEAIVAARRAHELAPELARLEAALARLLQQAGQDDAALEFLKSLIGRDQSASNRLLLARSLGNVGDADASANQLRRLLSLEPDHLEAALQLGLLEVRVGNHTLGLERLRTLARANPTSSLAIEVYARALCDAYGSEDPRSKRAADDWSALFGIAEVVPKGHWIPAARLRVGWWFVDDDPSFVGRFVPRLLELAREGWVTEILTEGATAGLLGNVSNLPVTILPMGSNHEVAAFVASRGLDLLIDPVGPTRGGRLRVLAHEPAPMILSFSPVPLGLPAACGLCVEAALDSLSSDELVGLLEQAVERERPRAAAVLGPNAPTGSRRLPLDPGLSLVVPESLKVITTFVIAEQECWFEDELNFVRSLVRPGDVVVDVGANLGVYALPLARAVTPAGRIVAFEPSAATAQHLRTSVALNELPWLRVEQVALGETAGEATLVHGNSPELHEIGQGIGEKVRIATLDDYAEDVRGLRFLKLDAEGFEEAVLRGGRRVLRAEQPIVMFEVKHGSRVNVQLVDGFRSLGFACYSMCPGLAALRAFDAGVLDGYQLNLFAVTPSRVGELVTQGLLVDETKEGLRLDELVQEGSKIAAAQSVQTGTEVPREVALAAFAFDRRRDLSDRARALDAACAVVFAHLEDDLDPFDRLAAARILRARGERKLAVRTLSCLLERPPRVARPKRWVLPAVEGPTLDSYDDASLWLQEQAIEAHVRWSAFSSCFNGEDAYLHLTRLRGLQAASKPMMRRLGLLAMARGSRID